MVNGGRIMPNLLFSIQLCALWLCWSALLSITTINLIAYFNRADCTTPLSTVTNSTSSPAECNSLNKIASLLLHHSSYFQSVNIIILQLLASTLLSVLRPFLRSRVWRSLGANTDGGAGGTPRQRITIQAFESSIGLSNAPKLTTGLTVLWHTWSISFPLVFVSVISLLSLGSPLAVSSIYRSRKGGYDTVFNFTTRGGVGPNAPTTFDSTYTVAAGITAGRAIINSQTALNAKSNSTSPSSFTPFLIQDEISQIQTGEVRTAVAWPTVTCDSTAPRQLSGFPVDIDLSYWSSGVIDISLQLGNITLGSVNNEPQVSTAYANANVTVKTGSVESVTSVLFFAGNGTIEGAQQRITTPSNDSRLLNLDILVCTSSLALKISDCSIKEGFVEECTPTDPSLLSSSVYGDQWGGLDIYVSNPTAVAILLSAAPVVYGYNIEGQLPMYSTIDSNLVAAGLPPISYLTSGTSETYYTIPLQYVKDALFSVPMNGLIQGMMTAWQNYSVESVQLEATFATSNPWLQIAILAIAFISSLLSTLLSTIPKSSRRAVELNLTRLLAISRNPDLDFLLAPYSELAVPIPDEMLKVKVQYRFEPSLDRSVLAIVNDGDIRSRERKWRDRDKIFSKSSLYSRAKLEENSSTTKTNSYVELPMMTYDG